jgi:hypothetical protein
VIFTSKPTDCWEREIAHEALHSVFRGGGHKDITGPDGLEGCISCAAHSK